VNDISTPPPELDFGLWINDSTAATNPTQQHSVYESPLDFEAENQDFFPFEDHDPTDLELTATNPTTQQSVDESHLDLEAEDQNLFPCEDHVLTYQELTATKPTLRSVDESHLDLEAEDQNLFPYPIRNEGEETPPVLLTDQNEFCLKFPKVHENLWTKG
jgi:hypothetical protein